VPAAFGRSASPRTSASLFQLLLRRRREMNVAERGVHRYPLIRRRIGNSPPPRRFAHKHVVVVLPWGDTELAAFRPSQFVTPNDRRSTAAGGWS
jgi:hypothetical protein